MNKFKHLIKTILISGMAVSVNFIISFLLTPYITTRVGTDAYGYVSLSKTFIGYFELFTIAINSYAARYIAIEYHRGNLKKANIYYSTVFYSDIFIGICLFIAGMVLSFNVDRIFDVRLNILRDVRLLFFLTFVNWFVNIAGTSYTTASYIKNRLDLAGIFKCLSYGVQIIILILLFSVSKPHVTYMGIGTLATTLVILSGNLYISRKYASNLIINRKLFDFKSARELVLSGIWNSLNSLGNILNSGLDLIVCNLMISSAAMGELAIAKTFSSFFSMLFQIITQPFQPLLLKNYADKNTDKLIENFKLAMKLCGMVSVVIVSGFIAVGRDFYKMWLSAQNNELLYILTILSIGTAIAEGIAAPLYYIYTLTVKNKVPCIVTVAGGLLNVLFMYVLIRYTTLGVYAISITTILIMGVINLIFNPIYMSYCLEIPWWSFYDVIIKHLSAFVLVTVIYSVIAHWITINNAAVLIIVSVLFGIMGAIIYILLQFNNSDIRKYIHMIVRRKIKRWL